ncbi:MAG: hypothetical protein ILO42_04595 [Clostridia bacterium]|nr:hypothetical protein [Clostridia bacterium]MBP5270219.1 hypothetical protein [Clostridia bacterium]
MKTALKRTVCAILCLAAALSLIPAAGCSNTGDVMLKLGKAEITENMFVFWLSRFKGQFIYAYGASVKQTYGVSSVDAFWSLKDENGKTYDEIMTEYLYENTVTYLVSCYLFDKYGLSLSSDDKKEITDRIDSLREELVSGSKSEFNALLAGYGFNSATLEACYTVEKKTEILQEYLFSAGGPEEITDDAVDAYYRANYQRMEHICIFINTRPDTADDGSFLTDSDGHVIYRDMSAAETAAARERASDALAKLAAGIDFATVSAEYNENTAGGEYSDGIYLCRDTVYDAGNETEKIYDALTEMNDGDVRLVELSDTLHIIRKLSLGSRAWEDSRNADFFSFYDSRSGGYVGLKYYIRTPLFLDLCEKTRNTVAAEIKSDEEVRGRHTVAGVTANYLF